MIFNEEIAQGLEKVRFFTKLEPLAQDGWARMVHTCAMVGQFEPAIRYGERALALRPIFSRTFHTLGIVAVNEERFDDGIRYFEATLVNSRPSVVNLRPLVHCYKETGDHEKAKACLERAEALRDEPSAPGPISLRNESGDLVIEDEEEGRAEGLCHLGRLLAQEGNLDEARKKFLEAMDEDPELAEPHWNLALLEQMGFRDLEKAISHWEAARERMPDDGFVSQMEFLTRKLTLAHYHQGRLEKAVKVLSTFASNH